MNGVCIWDFSTLFTGGRKYLISKIIVGPKIRGRSLLMGNNRPECFSQKSPKFWDPLFFPYKFETPYFPSNFSGAIMVRKFLLALRHCPAVGPSVWDLDIYEREFPAVGFHDQSIFYFWNCYDFCDVWICIFQEIGNFEKKNGQTLKLIWDPLNYLLKIWDPLFFVWKFETP